MHALHRQDLLSLLGSFTAGSVRLVELDARDESECRAGVMDDLRTLAANLRRMAAGHSMQGLGAETHASLSFLAGQFRPLGQVRRSLAELPAPPSLDGLTEQAAHRADLLYLVALFPVHWPVERQAAMQAAANLEHVRSCSLNALRALAMDVRHLITHGPNFPRAYRISSAVLEIAAALR